MVLGLLACTSDAPSPTAVPITIDVVELGAQERRLDVGLAEANDATLVCTGGDDAIALASESSDAHTFTLIGLLEATRYDCTVNAGDAQRSLVLPIGGSGTPVMTIAGTPPADKLVLTGLFDRETVFGDHTAVVVDSQGRRRWSHVVQAGADVAIQWLHDRVLLAGGGLPPTLIGLDHTVIFDGSATLTAWYHHEARMLDDGTILTLIETEDTNGVETWTGFQIQRVDPTTGTVAWAWSSQDATDAGLLLPGESIDIDPFHSNSVTLDRVGDREFLLLNLRDIFQIWAIAPESGEVLWRLGDGGDFTLQNPETDAWWGQTHAPELRGDILTLFENNAPHDASRSHARSYQLDLDARTATAVWQWTRPGWSDRAWGDVDTTGADTTAITENMRIVEVRHADAAELWSMTPANGALMYRSELLDACELPGRCAE